MSLIARLLIGLISGLVVGTVITATENAHLYKLVSIIEPVGTVWVNALRMTLIPLVFSLLIKAVASDTNVGSIGQIGLKAILLFLVMLFAAATFARWSHHPC